MLITKYPGKDERSTLLRERLAEESVWQKPRKVRPRDGKCRRDYRCDGQYRLRVALQWKRE